MKKSLLALAVATIAASANAATVYEKDGTSLTLDGRVQSVFYSGNYSKAGENDSSLQNSGRFGIGGKTQITDWVAGIGYAQWDVADGSTDNFRARDQWVGADFGDFGKLQAGRLRDAAYFVEEVTDHYEDAADNLSGNFNGERRNGQLMYTYDNYGFHGQLGIQTAQDGVKVFKDKHKVFGLTDSYNVDSGFSTALGYTFDDVLFGPLGFRVGYSYLKGQKNGDISDWYIDEDFDYSSRSTFNKFKHANASIVWGNLNSGLYLAALYDYAKFKGFGAYGGNSARQETARFDQFYDENYKVKGVELAVGYAWENGISMLVGYEYAKYTSNDEGDVTSVKVKRIPVFVNYKINPNFNVWAEAGFNAGSDRKDIEENPLSKNVYRSVFSIGARYTF